MVHGLEKFKTYFKDYTTQYVFIGGTAYDILMEELGAPFRATKDLDVVLIIEALDASFGKKFGSS
jgi:predicted nucleotidyltransferase